MYILWMPVLQHDDRTAADARALEFYDGRMRYYWDTTSAAGFAYQRVLQWPDMVWDAYLLYPPDARWSEEIPPQPIFYMHQRGTEFTGGALLNRDQLEAKIKQLLPPAKPPKPASHH